jgi:hypothetical protein
MIVVPAMNVCGHSTAPAEVAALPNPDAPPEPGSPAVTVAGVPAGTVVVVVTTYLDSAISCSPP